MAEEPGVDPVVWQSDPLAILTISSANSPEQLVDLDGDYEMASASETTDSTSRPLLDSDPYDDTMITSDPQPKDIVGNATAPVAVESIEFENEPLMHANTTFIAHPAAQNDSTDRPEVTTIATPSNAQSHSDATLSTARTIDFVKPLAIRELPQASMPFDLTHKDCVLPLEEIDKANATVSQDLVNVLKTLGSNPDNSRPLKGLLRAKCTTLICKIAALQVRIHSDKDAAVAFWMAQPDPAMLQEWVAKNRSSLLSLGENTRELKYEAKWFVEEFKGRRHNL